MKNAILTIDDAPSSDFRSKVAILQELGVPAVFFCTGSLIRKREKELIESIHAGFILGNHSYNHHHFSKLTLRQCERQIIKASVLIDKVYKMAGIQRPVKWFRFPYGDKGDGRMGNIFEPASSHGKTKRDAIQKILSDNGYTFDMKDWLPYKIFDDFEIKTEIDWTWTFDVMEWSILMSKPMMNLSSVDKVLERMEEASPIDCRGNWDEPRWLDAPFSREIILTHDHAKNTTFFRSLIEKMLSLGIQFPTEKVFPHHDDYL